MDRQKATPMAVRQVEAAFHATLRPPAFQFGERWADFQGAIFARLSPFGLRLGDIKVETPTGNPADFSVACWILGFSAAVRYRFDRIEVWTNSLPLLSDLDRAGNVVTAAVSVAQDLNGGASLAGRSVVIGVHVQPPADFVRLTLSRLVPQVPKGSPVLTPSGMAFSCDIADGTASIIIEGSNQLPEGLFLRVTAEYNRSVSEVDVLSRTSKFIEELTPRIGVDLLWEEQ